MISRYVKEQKRYSKKNLADIFAFSEDETVEMIRRLKQFGVMVSVPNCKEQFELSDLDDDDVVTSDGVDAGDDRYLYVFKYVGMIMYKNRIIKCYPKYFISSKPDTDDMKQILKVIAKYDNSKKQFISIENNDDDISDLNELSVILYLLNDYYEFGLYRNTENIIESNGEGDILWDRTIDERFPLISNNRPYYMDLLTRRKVYNDADYFYRLHKAVLADCSNQLNDVELLNLFDIEPVILTEESISDFGENDYILEQINNELSKQFNTRKQILLKTMYAYIHNKEKIWKLNNGISFYGTSAFNMVWEKACAEVFDNMLNRKINELPLKDKHDDNTLLEIIEKPIWYAKTDNGEIYHHEAKKTLKPDLITIKDHMFYIFDAKYYCLHLEKNELAGQPGIESITKQYLYQRAYENFTAEQKLDGVVNCFLLPTEMDKIVDKGFVELKMLHDYGLENIEVRLLPARKVFDAYVNNHKLDLNDMNLRNYKRNHIHDIKISKDKDNRLEDAFGYWGARKSENQNNAVISESSEEDIKLEAGDPPKFIEDLIKYNFHNKNLLRQAFISQSFASENKLSDDNEELKFFGESLLKMFIKKKVYGRYVKKDENNTRTPITFDFSDNLSLSELCEKYSSKEYLSRRAKELELDQYILCGEENLPNETVCSDSIEALIGAIAADSNWDNSKIELALTQLIQF